MYSFTFLSAFLAILQIASSLPLDTRSDVKETKGKSDDKWYSSSESQSTTSGYPSGYQTTTSSSRNVLDDGIYYTQSGPYYQSTGTTSGYPVGYSTGSNGYGGSGLSSWTPVSSWSGTTGRLNQYTPYAASSVNANNGGYYSSSSGNYYPTYSNTAGYTNGNYQNSNQYGYPTTNSATYSGGYFPSRYNTGSSSSAGLSQYGYSSSASGYPNGVTYKKDAEQTTKDAAEKQS